MNKIDSGRRWKHLFILGSEIAIPFLPAIVGIGANIAQVNRRQEPVLSDKTINNLFLSSLILRTGALALTTLATNSIELGLLAQCLVGIVEVAVLLQGLNKMA